MDKRRIAASEVWIDDQCFSNYVVEVEDGILTDHYPLNGELPNTIWAKKVRIKDNRLSDIENR